MSETRPRGRRASGLPSVARHGRLRRSKPWLTALKYLGAAMAVVLVSGVTVAGYAIWKIGGSRMRWPIPSFAMRLSVVLCRVTSCVVSLPSSRSMQRSESLRRWIRTESSSQRNRPKAGGIRCCQRFAEPIWFLVPVKYRWFARMAPRCPRSSPTLCCKIESPPQSNLQRPSAMHSKRDRISGMH